MTLIFSDTFTGGKDPSWTSTGAATVAFTGNKLNISPSGSSFYYLTNTFTPASDTWFEARFKFTCSVTSGFFSGHRFSISDLTKLPVGPGTGYSFNHLYLEAKPNGNLYFSSFVARPDSIQATNHYLLPVVAGQVYDIKQRYKNRTEAVCFTVSIDGEELLRTSIRNSGVTMPAGSIVPFFGYFSANTLSFPITLTYDDYEYSSDLSDDSTCWQGVDLSRIRFRSYAIPSSGVPEWTLRSSSMDGSVPNDAVSVWSETLGLFVVLTSRDPDTCLTSPDGINWTGHGDPFSTWGGPAGIYGALGLNDSTPMLIATTARAAEPYISSDGVNWTNISHGAFLVTDREGTAVYSPSLDRWLATTSSITPPGRVATSDDDGATWTTHSLPWGNGNVHAACWSEDLSLFVVCATTAFPYKMVATSPDGATWTDQTAGVPASWFPSGWPYQVVWSPMLSKFVAVGADAGNDHTIMSSPDGATWTNAPNDPYAPPVAADYWGEAEAVIEAEGKIWTAGYREANTSAAASNVFSTTDLSTWIDENCPLDGNTYSISYSPSLRRLLVVGKTYSGTGPIFATMDL